MRNPDEISELGTEQYPGTTIGETGSNLTPSSLSPQLPLFSAWLQLGQVVAKPWLLLGAGRVTQASQWRVRNLEREQKIARELHDIVSHAVTVMVLQAAGAARVADTNMTQVKQSLTHIETVGKQVMAELRQLLRVLQAGDLPSNAVGTNGFRPQPGLADLTGLLVSFQDTGMPVTLRIEGTTHNLAPSVDLAAYRIVQTAVTD